MAPPLRRRSASQQRQCANAARRALVRALKSIAPYESGRRCTQCHLSPFCMRVGLLGGRCGGGTNSIPNRAIDQVGRRRVSQSLGRRRCQRWSQLEGLIKTNGRRLHLVWIPIGARYRMSRGAPITDRTVICAPRTAPTCAPRARARRRRKGRALERGHLPRTLSAQMLLLLFVRTCELGRIVSARLRAPTFIFRSLDGGGGERKVYFAAAAAAAERSFIRRRQTVARICPQRAVCIMLI